MILKLPENKRSAVADIKTSRLQIASPITPITKDCSLGDDSVLCISRNKSIDIFWKNESNMLPGKQAASDGMTSPAYSFKT